MFYKDYHVSQATGCTVWQLENPPSSSRDPLWSHSTSPFQNHLEAILCGASVWGGEWRGLRLRLRPLTLLSVVCRGGVKVEGGVQDCPQYSQHQCHKWTISISQYQSISKYLNMIIRNCFVSPFIFGPANYWDKEKWYVFWFYFLSIPVLRDTKIFTEYDKGERWETCLRGNNNQGPLRTVLFYSSRGDDLSKFGKIRRSKYIPSLKVLHFTNILNLNLKSYDNLEQFSHWFIQI